MSQSLNTLFGVIIFHNFLPDSGAKFWRQTFSRSKTFVPETKKKYFLTRSSELKFSRLDRRFFFIFVSFWTVPISKLCYFCSWELNTNFTKQRIMQKALLTFIFLLSPSKRNRDSKKTLPNSSLRFLKNQKWSITLSKRWIQKMKIKNEKK